MDAMESLLKRGIKLDDIVTWNSILSSFKGPGEFARELDKYIGIKKLLKAKAEEMKRVESQVGVLQKKKAEIEAAIETVRVAGVEEVKRMGQELVEQLELLLERTFEAGEKVERMKQDLQRYERVKEIFESTSEEAK